MHKNFNKKRVAIIGAGGHAKVVASILIAQGHHIIGFYDDDSQKWGESILGIPIIGSVSELTSVTCDGAIIGVGDNKTRKQLAERMDLDWITAIHPFSWVHPDVSIGVGTIVCAGSIVQPGAKIGNHVILNTRASVDHDCVVGDYVHISVAHLAGAASTDEGAFLALGSTVLPGLNVGAWAHLGAGSVATKNIPAGSVAIGSPARVIKSAVEAPLPVILSV